MKSSEDAPEDVPPAEPMEVQCDVPGSARKAMASAIGEIVGAFPSDRAASGFACIIGESTPDRSGVLAGPRNSQLILTLEQDGYHNQAKGQPRSRHSAGCGCPCLICPCRVAPAL